MDKLIKYLASNRKNKLIKVTVYKNKHIIFDSKQMYLNKIGTEKEISIEIDKRSDGIIRTSCLTNRGDLFVKSYELTPSDLETLQVISLNSNFYEIQGELGRTIGESPFGSKFYILPIYRLDNGLLNVLLINQTFNWEVYCTIPCALYSRLVDYDKTIYGQSITKGITTIVDGSDEGEVQIKEVLSIFGDDSELYGANKITVDNFGNLIALHYTRETVGYFDFESVKEITSIHSLREEVVLRGEDTLIIDSIIGNISQVSHNSFEWLIELGANAISLLGLNQIPEYRRDIRARGVFILTELQFTQEIGTQALRIVLQTSMNLMIVPDGDYTLCDLLNPEENAVIKKSRLYDSLGIKFIKAQYLDNYGEITPMEKSVEITADNLSKVVGFEVGEHTEDTYGTYLDMNLEFFIQALNTEEGQKYIKQAILTIL